MKRIILKLIFFLCFITPYLQVYAQKETNIWYFGKNAGIDFGVNPPQVLQDSRMNTEEGCVTICDQKGFLLFYTDGITVWDKRHQVMTNGTGLKGHSSSTQSGVVILKPGQENIYYLFTVAATATVDGFRYSVIDMGKNNGLGEVNLAEKDILLSTPVTEKLTSVKHRNGMDIWVIVHEWQTNVFLAYLVTGNGVNKEPVKSNVGKIHEGTVTNTQGYLKSNPDGTNLALALEDSHLVELFDFDNATGKVANPITLQFPSASYPYGIEFSPNGSVLYASAAGIGAVFQYNLQAGDAEAIKKSVLKIGNSPKGEWIGALQVAIDGKIYFPIYGTPYLGIIEFPNKIGIDCNYKNNVINLGEGVSQLGLPTFIQSFFNKPAEIQEITYFNDQKIELGKALILSHIYFEFDRYVLKQESYPELEKLVGFLKTNPTLNIKIKGHTDNIGNKAYNIELSSNRAKTVKDFLIQKGILENKIISLGLGSIEPIAPNDTEEGRTKNRRVEFILEK